MILYFCTDYYPIPKIAESECVSFDLDSISKRGRLIAITDFNSINYFIYKGESMGFHYELLKSFADQIGIDVEIIAENDPEKAYAMLKSGEADIIAIDSDTTMAATGKVRFSQPLDGSRLVLVQRKPGNWAEPGTDRSDRLLVRSTADLAGLPPGKWARVKITCLLGDRSDGTFDFQLAVEGEQPRTFSALPCAKGKDFKRASWIGLLCHGQGTATIHLDNLKFTLQSK